MFVSSQPYVYYQECSWAQKRYKYICIYIHTHTLKFFYYLIMGKPKLIKRKFSSSSLLNMRSANTQQEYHIEACEIQTLRPTIDRNLQNLHFHMLPRLFTCPVNSEMHNFSPCTFPSLWSECVTFKEITKYLYYST